MFEEGRKLYTGEINAAVRGAKAAGATEIVVMDCHGAGEGYTFNSLIPEDLDPACEYVVQEEWTEYTGFLEEGCDAALFVGMHAMAGTPRTASSTTRSRDRRGRTSGSTGRRSARRASTRRSAARGAARCCSSRATRLSCREGKELLGDGLTTVSVKTGIGQTSARMLVPARARELIEEGAKQALSDLKAVAPLRPRLDRASQGRVQEQHDRGQADALPATASSSSTTARSSPGRRLVDGLEAVLLVDS